MRTDNDSVDFLRWCVEQSSPSRHEGTFAQALAGRLDDLGWHTAVDEVGNVIAVVGTGPKRIGLLGHIDTVPGEIPVRIDGGRLFGRGSVDAKGSMVAFTEAVMRLPETDRQGKQFVLYGCVEEESSTSKGAVHVSRTEPPDFLINGEPSGWDGITLGYKGLVRLAVECRVERTHSAARDYRAPAEFVVDAWNNLDRFSAKFNDGKKLFDQLIPSLRRFETRWQEDVELASAIFNVRIGPDIRDEHLLDALDTSAPVSVAMTKNLRAVSTHRDNPLVRTFRSAIRQAGGCPRPRLKTGTTDWNTVADDWDVPTVAYGPGDSSLDHTPNEHLPLSDFMKAIHVLRQTLATL